MTDTVSEIINTFVSELERNLNEIKAKYKAPDPNEVAKSSAKSVSHIVEQLFPPTPKEIANAPNIIAESLPKPRDIAKALLETAGITPKSKLDLVADVSSIIGTGLVIILLILLLTR